MCKNIVGQLKFQFNENGWVLISEYTVSISFNKKRKFWS